jgi:hypothetical protein
MKGLQNAEALGENLQNSTLECRGQGFLYPEDIV